MYSVFSPGRKEREKEERKNISHDDFFVATEYSLNGYPTVVDLYMLLSTYLLQMTSVDILEAEFLFTTY